MNHGALDSDGTIIAAVVAGEADRFARLVERYQQPLARVAESRLGRREWAEEAVQETFLCAFKSLHSYDSRFSFRTWLWTILLNQCHRHYQRRMRHPQVASWSDHPDLSGTDRGEQPACSQPDPVAQLVVKERSERLQLLLGHLPAVQADALRLRFFGDLKFQEIADAMGCSLSSAKNRVRCGLVLLSELLRAPEREGPTGLRCQRETSDEL